MYGLYGQDDDDDSKIYEDLCSLRGPPKVQVVGATGWPLVWGENIAGTRRKVSHGIISFEAVYFCIDMCLFTGRQNQAFQFLDAMFITVFARQELCFRMTACRIPTPGMFNEACIQWKTQLSFCVHWHKCL